MNPVAWLLSRLLGLGDWLYVALSATSKAKFFADGFGDADTTKRIEAFYKDVGIPAVGQLQPRSDILTQAFAELDANVDLVQPSDSSEVASLLGTFTSPMADFLPAESKACKFLLLKPPQGVPVRGVCVMLPATGDMGFKLRRKLYADALAKAGIVGILVIAPLYGARKPPGQDQWFVRSVQKLLLQAQAITLEANCLLQWARERFGCAVGITGISFGGAMSCLAALMHRGDLAVISYMGCPSPGQPFANGILAGSVEWGALKMEPNMMGVSTDTTDIQTCLREYLDFATDLGGVRRQTLKRGPDTGFRALHQIQAQHDAFVCSNEGAAMFGVMSKGHELSSKYVAMIGGHVSGFLKAPSILVPAVLEAFDVLKKAS